MGTGPDPKEKGSHGDSSKESAESGGLLAGIKKVMKWVGKKIGLLLENDEKAAVQSPVPESSHVATPAAEVATEVKKHSPLFPALIEKLKTDGKKVLEDIGALLKSETVKDEADLRILNDAKSFIENPTGNLEEITKHSTNVGHVQGGYDQQGKEAPPAIDALSRHLFAMICVNRIKFIEDQIEKGNSASQEVKEALKMADDRATLLSRGWKDDTLLTATNKLRERLK